MNVENDATEEKLRKKVVTVLHLLLQQKRPAKTGVIYLQRLDRKTRRIGVVNNESIELIINDFEQVCSASGCGYRGTSGKQPSAAHC